MGRDVSGVVRRTEAREARGVEAIRGAVVAAAGEELGGVGGAHGLAVPACAFAVHLAEVLLVFLAGPLEAVGELVLVDLVVVIDEAVAGGVADGVAVVRPWAQLMRVPREVDIECWDGNLVGVGRHDSEEPVIFG